MSIAHLKPEAREIVNQEIDDQNEAFTLLDLILAEWESDSNSTACFDRRIIDRTRNVVLRHNKRVKRCIFGRVPR